MLPKDIYDEEDINNMKDVIDVGLSLNELSDNRGWRELKNSALQKISELEETINESEKDDDVLRSVYVKRGIKAWLDLYDEMLDTSDSCRESLAGYENS